MVADLVLPNLVILGPPKCGTSSLFGWLTSHPQICGSHRKETFYLIDPDNPLRGESHFNNEGWEGYARQFPDEARDCPVRIEATTHYLYQRTALEILSEIKDLHVCVILRDPAARVWSSFNFTQNTLARLPAWLTFNQYLDLVFDEQPLYPRYCVSEKSAYVLERDLQYGEYARYLRPWIDRLGADRVHCVLFEDLKDRPRDVVKRLTAPFDVNAAYFDRHEFTARNETYSVKQQRLHRVARRANELLQVDSRIKAALKRVYFGLQRGSSNGGARAPREQTLERLRVHFELYNQELEDLLSVDLRGWMPRGGGKVHNKLFHFGI